MNRKKLALGYLLMLALSEINSTASLKCHSCSNVLNIRQCESTKICNEGQVCFKRRHFTDKVQFDLGCIDKEVCGMHAKLQNGSEVAKMSADQTSPCYECCSNDKCNKDLCEYPPHSLCKDDATIDCAKWDSMFSICKITSQAKKICPKHCNLCSLVDGNWSPWSYWSTCDVTCGKGSLLRHRTCTNPAPQHGGLECPGKSTETKMCSLQSCPVHGGWTPWGNWGKCSATCGVGMRIRKRSCTNPRPQRLGDHCFGDATTSELCNKGTCAVNGGWNDWTQWGQCSVTCGVGLQRRSRSCTNPTPSNAGQHCIGQNYDVKMCYQNLCPVEWTAWQSWSKCNGPCERKVQTRIRTCKQKSQFTMACKGTSETRSCVDKKCYTDCKEIKEHTGKQASGVYSVRLWKTNRTISVYCDFDTASGGWTVFQRRINGSVDFNRNFAEYQQGFGQLSGEFWFGLDYIYEMVSQWKSELRLDLTSTDGKTAYETFQNFRLDEGPSYTLRIDKGVGTAGDSGRGLSHHNGQKFSTYDNDQDNDRGNCAAEYHGGWWYDACYLVNLNGKYSVYNSYHSFNNYKPLKVTRMMFRRV